MSGHREYYLNNPYEMPVKEDDDMEWLENAIEDAADEDTFAAELLFNEYVDYDIAKATLRAMFKSYCKLMHSAKKSSKEEADADLLIFTKSLMSAMYVAAESIVAERGE
jgi:hypothetical protein